MKTEDVIEELTEQEEDRRAFEAVAAAVRHLPRERALAVIDRSYIVAEAVFKVEQAARTDALERVRQEAKAEALREAAAVIGVKVGHSGATPDCQCGMCVARREDHAAILTLIPDQHKEDG